MSHWPGHDALAFFEFGDVSTEVDDFTGEIAAEDGGELDRHASAGGAAAEFPVDGVDAGGAHANAHFVWPEGWLLLIGFVLKLVAVAVFVKNNCIHRKYLLVGWDDGEGRLVAFV